MHMEGLMYDHRNNTLGLDTSICYFNQQREFFGNEQREVSYSVTIWHIWSCSRSFHKA